MRGEKNMKYSVKFSDAIHIMSYLEIYKGTDLSSDTIARSVEANAVSVRKIMSELKSVITSLFIGSWC